jgi:hypothetical protein
LTGIADSRRSAAAALVEKRLEPQQDRTLKKHGIKMNRDGRQQHP